MVSGIGTTTLGFLLPGLITFAIWLYRFVSTWSKERKEGKNMKNIFKSSLRWHDLAIFFIAWVIVFACFVVNTIYKDHQALMSQIKAKDNIIKELDRQILSLKKKPKSPDEIQKIKKYIQQLYAFLQQGTIIQAQCGGTYIEELKGKTTHDRWREWSADIDNFFRKELDFEMYHSWVENSDYTWQPIAGMQPEDVSVWYFVRQKKNRLQEMIDDFKRQLSIKQLQKGSN